MSKASKAKKKADIAAEEKIDTSASEETGDGTRALMANKLYTRQLPDVLPENYNEAEDAKALHGNRICYDCCTEDKGCCSPGCTICLIGTAAICCLLCCYTTDGFNGAWTYWPN